MTMQLIQTVTVGSGGAANIEFTNIPQTYTDLCLVIDGRTNINASRDGIYIAPNGSSSNLSRRNLIGLDSNAIVTNSLSNGQVGNCPGATATSNTFGSTSIYIPNYAGSTNKSISSDMTTENNSSTLWVVGIFAVLWSNTAAITSIKLTTDGGSFVQHSVASLYGITKGSDGTTTVS